MPVLIALLIGFGGHQLPKDLMPANLAGAQRIGCRADQNGTKAEWRTRVWIEFPQSERWERLYSVREDVGPALKDCDQWIKAARKKLGWKK